MERPSHAFPASYPPLCAYEPFPLRGSSRCFPVSWLRCSAPSRSRLDPSHSTDASELLDLLGKLDIGGKVDAISSPTNPVAIGFVCVLPQAPLPALLSSSTLSVDTQNNASVWRSSPRHIGPVHPSSRRCTEEAIATSIDSFFARCIQRESKMGCRPTPRSASQDVARPRKTKRKHLRSVPNTLHTDSPATDTESNNSSVSPPSCPYSPYVTPTSISRRSRRRTTTRSKPATLPHRLPRSWQSSTIPCTPQPSPSPRISVSPTPLTPPLAQSTPPLSRLLRASSVSSMRSVSSCSSTSSDSDLLITPPLTPLPDDNCAVKGDAPAYYGLYSDINNLLDGSFEEDYLDYSLDFAGDLRSGIPPRAHCSSGQINVYKGGVSSFIEPPLLTI